MSDRKGLHLFEGYGIEMEYMIVDRDTLNVRPITHQILQHLANGEIVSDVEIGEIGLSNELVLHVIEFKCNGPRVGFRAMHRDFQREVKNLNELLATKWNACLLPTAMHPFMNPDLHTKLWPHGYSEIYETYNRIFGCKGHGWSNLQSVHINLPFDGADEFGRLHAAVRAVLPLLPTLAASSPIVEGKVSGLLDSRLEFYRNNQKRIHSITGHVIPEAVFTPADYEAKILQRLYKDISEHDPKGVLQEEWLNSRGAIARFDRNAIEIRVLDIQESVRADFAVITLVCSLLKAMIKETWSSFDEQQKLDEKELEKIFIAALKQGSDLVIADVKLLKLFGFESKGPGLKAGEFWSGLLERLAPQDEELRAFQGDLNAMLKRGCLAKALLKRLGDKPAGGEVDPLAVTGLYRELSACLAEDRIFLP